MSRRRLGSALLAALLAGALGAPAAVARDVPESGSAAASDDKAPAAETPAATSPAPASDAVRQADAAEPRAHRAQSGGDQYEDPFANEKPPPAPTPQPSPPSGGGSPATAAPSAAPPAEVASTGTPAPVDSTATDTADSGSSTTGDGQAELPRSGMGTGSLAGLGFALLLSGAALRRRVARL